jgi:hypothetical protein
VAAPDKLLIQYEDYDYGRFHYVGRYGSDNQFLGFVTYAAPKYYHREETTADGQTIWREYTNCFAVLHRFDAEGEHIGTDVVRVEGTRDSNARDWTTFDQLLAGLGEVKFCDISIKLFSVEVEGVVHGLFYEHQVEDDYEGEWVMLEPRDIMFHPPWDSGEYST